MKETVLLVSPSQSAAGETIDAADINTPVNQIAAVLNGNLDDDNILSVSGSKLVNGTVTNAKLSTVTGEPGGSWNTWTPTWTNLTIGNASQSARYIQIGKFVHCRILVSLGSSSSVGTSPTFTLPVTSTSTGYSSQTHFLGTAWLQFNYGAVRWNSTTTADMVVFNSAGTYVVANGISATVPTTWANGSVISCDFVYEAA